MGCQKEIYTPSGNVEIRSGMVSSFYPQVQERVRIPKAQLEEHGLQLVTLYPVIILQFLFFVIKICSMLYQ